MFRGLGHVCRGTVCVPRAERGKRKIGIATSADFGQGWIDSKLSKAMNTQSSRIRLGALLVSIGLLAGISVTTRADSWAVRAPAPGARAAHSAIWTGHEMIVFGGGIDGSFLDTGGRFLVASNTWQATSLSNAPSPRWFHAAAWTGNEMLIWGGRPSFSGDANRNDGGRYDPVSDIWRPISTHGAPAARSQCAAVWTGTELLVWGGATDGGIELNDGARYNPGSDTWRPISASGLSPRMEPAFVWTGNELIVFGGMKFTGGQLSFGDGARYDPAADTWKPLPATHGPGSRTGHTAVWTGSRMIVWGGREVPSQVVLDSGAGYDPGSNEWTPLAVSVASPGRMYHAAIWSGGEMIVWGGQRDLWTIVNTGARWNAASGMWSSTTQVGAPGKRQFWRPDLGVWTGEGMLICAGSDYPASLDSTYLYRPAATTDPPSASCLTAPGGLVGWWPLDGAANDLVHSNTLTMSGATNYVPGRVGQALQFDGVSTYGSAADSAALNVGLGEGFSIEAWVNPDDVTYRPIVEYSPHSGVAGVHFWIGVYGSGSLFVNLLDVNGNSHSWRSDTGIVVPHVWQHVGMSYEKAPGLLRFYLNGVKVTEYHLGTFTPQTGYPILIGYRPNENARFIGAMDELSIYNRVLSDAEVQAIAASGAAGKCHTNPTNAPPSGGHCVPAPAEIVGWWPLDDSGSDLVGGNLMTVSGSASFVPGRVRQALQFDGVSTYGSVAASAALNVGLGEGFSIEAWVNPDDVTYRPIVEYSPHSGVAGVHFWIGVYGSGSLFVNLLDVNGNSHSWRSDTGIVVPHVWQHVGMSYEKAPGLLRFYLNGVKVTEYHLGTFTPQTGYPILIGYRPNENARFIGAMDELSIYNRVLSDAEMRAIAMADGAGKCRTPGTLDDLIRLVEDLPPSIHAQPLLASLEAAHASIARGNLVAAIHQLEAFQQKVRAQVSPGEPALGEELIQLAQLLIEALDGTGARRVALAAAAATPMRAVRLVPAASGALRVEGCAVPGILCCIQRSTDLRGWEHAGFAVEVEDGVFQFVDPLPPTGSTRFYRLLEP